jgi:hypothetical protein
MRDPLGGCSMTKTLPQLIYACVASVLIACASSGGPTPAQLEMALADSSYGYSPSNPIQVGGGARRGVLNERRFLESLRGPAGQPVSVIRRASCCMVSGRGPLDRYEITYEGLAEPVVLYLDMYVGRKVRAPNGFTLAR